LKTTSRPLLRRCFEGLLVLVLATVLVAYGTWRRTGDSGIASLADDEVAVVVDRWSGARRVETNPGRILFLPLVEKVHRLDKSPRSLVLQGSRAAGDDPVRGPSSVPQLIARAKDGSSFRLDKVELQYAIVPEAASEVLDDTGIPASLRTKLLAAAARSILRDEIGKFTAEAFVRGDSGPEIAKTAAERLRDLMRPHGVAILAVVLGKPVFDDEYEKAIQRRAAFAQEVERLDADHERLVADRPHKEAAADRDKQVELAKLEATLAVDLGAARAEDIRIRQEADDYHASEVQAGAATRREKEERAALQRDRYTAAARAVYREGLELEQQGDLAVRAALVKKLAGIQFDLAPHDEPDAKNARGKP
jgi:hypothetical protein